MGKPNRAVALSNLNRRSTLLMALAVCFAALASAGAARAQTLTPLNSFAGADGATPLAGVTVDAAGNLYGTTVGGGTQNCPQYGGCGTVFKLKHATGGWVLSTLYQFQGGADGSHPEARVVFGPDGALYGTTAGNLSNCGQDCGTVFRLTPPPGFCRSVRCPWIKTILYSFRGVPDGSQPLG